MKMDILKVRSETLRLNLKCTDDYIMTLLENPDAVDQIANGVGSEESIFYHFIPDTVYFLNINPSSHIHDWDYTFPQYFEYYREGIEWKNQADYRLYENMLIQIEDSWGAALRSLRRRRALKYYKILQGMGEAAFWAGKQKPVDWREHREVFS